MEAFQIRQYRKSSPLKLLREHNKLHKRAIKVRNRRMRHRKQLQQDIENNHNIFQSLHKSLSSQKSRTVQNVIWEKNYNLKMAINLLKQDNNSLKAKLWNVSKENRRMNKQIDCWNLNAVTLVKNDSGNASSTGSMAFKKPYIDMATVKNVFADKDYSIVSAKMQIGDLERELHGKEEEIEVINSSAGNLDRYLKHYDFQSNQSKMAIFQTLAAETQYQAIEPEQTNVEYIEINNESQGHSLRNCKERFEQKIMQANQQHQILEKNIQILKKLKKQYICDLVQNVSECEAKSQINRQTIDDLRQEIAQMKREDDLNLSQFKQRLRIAKNNTIAMECTIQSRMGDLIKQKLLLQNSISQQQAKIKVFRCLHSLKSLKANSVIDKQVSLQRTAENQETKQQVIRASPINHLRKSIEDLSKMKTLREEDGEDMEM